MNQSCRVCGEVAAGYHFGAFTCEGCKSFFGRTYNNRSSIGECKNQNLCIINKKNRTSCKSCRLKKCFSVGMSKSGSRYGRRSNWFKIHCLLQDQGIMQQQQQQQQQQLETQQQLENQQTHQDQLESHQQQLEIHQQQLENHHHHHHLHHQHQQQQQQQQQLQHHQQPQKPADRDCPSNKSVQTPIDIDAPIALTTNQNTTLPFSNALTAAAAAALAAQQRSSLQPNNNNLTDPNPDPTQLSSQMYASAIAQFFAYCYLVRQRPQ